MLVKMLVSGFDEYDKKREEVQEMCPTKNK